ncbi:MAG: prephenate dehydratase [Caeruleum heppii]|nr:MAG: prephenate dehydratase [Caeruleum heppii]
MKSPDEEMGKKKPAVAFLGPSSSYSYQATVAHFSTTSYTLSPQNTIRGTYPFLLSLVPSPLHPTADPPSKDVFLSTQSQTTRYGVVPFENSSNGAVIYTLDLLADRKDEFPDLEVSQEIELDIHHCLIGYTSAATSFIKTAGENAVTSITPAVLTNGFNTTTASSTKSPSLSHLRTIYSHPQALAQCAHFLSTHPDLRNLPQQEVTSTAKAASLVAADPSRTSAAIASEVAAEANGLEVLVRGCEDEEGNRTRFLVLRHKEDSLKNSQTTPTLANGSRLEKAHPKENLKHLITFTLPPPSPSASPSSTPLSSHLTSKSSANPTAFSTPGTLADILLTLAAHHLNITSINSRPSRLARWHYIFFIEVELMTRPETSNGAVLGSPSPSTTDHYSPINQTPRVGGSPVHPVAPDEPWIPPPETKTPNITNNPDADEGPHKKLLDNAGAATCAEKGSLSPSPSPSSIQNPTNPQPPFVAVGGAEVLPVPVDEQWMTPHRTPMNPHGGIDVQTAEEKNKPNLRIDEDDDEESTAVVRKAMRAVESQVGGWRLWGSWVDIRRG